MNKRHSAETTGMQERVISIDRVTRVVAGGRRFRFRALVVLGDKQGGVGMAVAKGGDVATAIAKASTRATKHLQKFPLGEGGSIPHEVLGHFTGAKVLLKPAAPGTGVIAGGAIRDVLEVAGVTNILSKRLGSTNKLNNCYATLSALSQLRAIPVRKPKTAPKATKAKVQ